ncbi:MAG: STAS/SEC14 domain-containing protein [Burkholderiales bacterium]
MLTLLKDLPDNTVGVSASGQVTAEDYETVLIPAVEAALGRHGKVRFLYELGAEFKGFAANAMWQDMKVGFAHFRKWEKVAVVTDVGWVAHAVGLFQFVMPCPVKAFSLKDAAEARAWISS